MIWSSDMDDTLIASWGSGLSSFEIAAVLGPPITASAVRGRRIDLGLPARGAATLIFAGQFKAAYRRPTTKALLNIESLGPLSQPRPFTDRDGWECAFVVGEGSDGVMACCGPVRPGSRCLYCDFHRNMTTAQNAA
jgi:hypothetical protein